ADRVEPDHLVDAAPGRHGRQRVGGGDPDHVGLDRHAHVVLHRAAMVAAAHGGDRHVGRARALDRLTHGEDAGHLTHAVAAVDYEGGARVLGHLRPAARIDPAPGQLADVERDPHYAVRMDPAQI